MLGMATTAKATASRRESYYMFSDRFCHQVPGCLDARRADADLRRHGTDTP